MPNASAIIKYRCANTICRELLEALELAKNILSTPEKYRERCWEIEGALNDVIVPAIRKAKGEL